MIRLEIVDPGNWQSRLKVSESQKGFVSDAYDDIQLLAKAYADRESRSRAFAIYHDDVPVGMALYCDCDERNAFEFSRIFIDEHYQGKGFGSEAVRQILKIMEADGKYDKVVLCYVEGNESAKNMYKKFGFYLTGECFEDEIFMQKVF